MQMPKIFLKGVYQRSRENFQFPCMQGHMFFWSLHLGYEYQPDQSNFQKVKSCLIAERSSFLEAILKTCPFFGQSKRRYICFIFNMQFPLCVCSIYLISDIFLPTGVTQADTHITGCLWGLVEEIKVPNCAAVLITLSFSFF